MSVDSKSQAKFGVGLRNLDWVTVDELSWHLHSGKVGPGARDASGGSAVACGLDRSGLHQLQNSVVKQARANHAARKSLLPTIVLMQISTYAKLEISVDCMAKF